MANTFVKHWRLLALAAGIILLIWVLYLLRIFVLPFALGLVLAYLLMPLVAWLEKRLPPRRKWPGFRRVMSVLIAMILLVAILGGFFYVIVTAVIDASTLIIGNAPYFIAQSILTVQQWFEGVIQSLPIEIQEDVSRELLNMGVTIGNSIRDGFLNSVANIPGTFGAFLGFAVLPFFLFYILKDSDRLKAGLSENLPKSVSRHGRNVTNILERVLGRYIRSQLLLALIVGYFSYVGLLLLDIPFPLALALLAAMGELVPTLGGWISGAVAVIVALAIVPDKAIWVAVLYVGIQAIENTLLVPKIQSAYLRIHPAVMIVLLVFGAYVAGLWGVLLIGPLVATLVEIFKYVRNHYRERELSQASGQVFSG